MAKPNKHEHRRTLPVRDFLQPPRISLKQRIGIYLFILLGTGMWVLTWVGIALGLELIGIHLAIGFVVGIAISSFVWLHVGRKIRRDARFKWLYPHDWR